MYFASMEPMVSRALAYRHPLIKVRGISFRSALAWQKSLLWDGEPATLAVATRWVRALDPKATVSLGSGQSLEISYRLPGASAGISVRLDRFLTFTQGDQFSSGALFDREASR